MSITGLLATLVLSASSIPAQTNSQPGSPKIACRQPVYEFGTVDNSQPIEHTFVIWNEGEAPLEISRIRACCGATAEITDKTILPGTSARLKIKFSLNDRSGKQQKSVYIASNDPKQPYYQLQLVGTAVVTTNDENTKEIVIPVRVASEKGGLTSADNTFEIGADGTVKVDGIEFNNLAEYVSSDYFKAMGKRCLIKGRYKRAELRAITSDCNLSQTVIQNEYWPSQTYFIPTVFHVIYKSDGTGNISDLRIYDQVEVLNQDFRAIFGSMGDQGFDTKIQFVLAGITRTVNDTWFNDNDEYGYKSALGWDQDRYFNVYINSGGSYLGYAYLPQDYAGDALDGVVILYEAVGGRNNGFDPYGQGRTLVHETGHYLGLLHTFEGGGCYEGLTAGDLIADTHSESTAHYGCSQTYTCETPDDIHNYMNYTDDPCMYQFTTQQANRAVCALVNYRPQLYQTTASMSGNCLDFDGTNDYVTIADHNQLDLTNNYTLEAWIYVHSFGSSNGIISKCQESATNGFILTLHGNAPYTGLSFDETQTATNILTTNRWYHVAAVNSNGTRLLYLNGIEQSLTGTALTVQANTSPLCIGVDSLAEAHYFDGRMDEVRIWNDARTETEIRDTIHKVLSGCESGLVANYRFDHTSGINLHEITANSLNGTLVNMESNNWVISTFPCASVITDRIGLRAVWDGQTNSLPSGRLSVADGDVAGTNFVVFGHNNSSEANNIIDIPSGIEWRLERIWQFEVQGTLTGTVVIALDGLSDIGDGSALRLLTDTDGSFTNAAIVEGNVSNTTFSVSKIAFADGPFMTLAKTGMVVVITASAGDHGNIEPAGAVYLVLGDSTNFVITPDTYYHIDDVTTNNTSVGAVTSFTWSSVSADGTIYAAFGENLAALTTPHWWLTQYGLTNGGMSFDEAETNDLDSDLFDAHDEYVADTDPTNPASYFYIAAISNLSSPDRLKIYFQSSSNRIYRLEYCTNLVEGWWANVPGQTNVSGAGGPDSLNDTNMPAGIRFYRIDVQLP